MDTGTGTPPKVKPACNESMTDSLSRTVVEVSEPLSLSQWDVGLSRILVRGRPTDTMVP